MDLQHISTSSKNKMNSTQLPTRVVAALYTGKAICTDPENPQHTDLEAMFRGLEKVTLKSFHDPITHPLTTTQWQQIAAAHLQKQFPWLQTLDASTTHEELDKRVCQLEAQFGTELEVATVLPADLPSLVEIEGAEFTRLFILEQVKEQYESLCKSVLTRSDQGTPSLYKQVQAYAEANEYTITDPRSLRDIAIASILQDQGKWHEIDATLSHSDRFKAFESEADQQQYLMQVKAVVSVAVQEQQEECDFER